ncbi:MAG: acetylxylan esterase [Bryobacteraceae bacterium]
MILTGDTSTRLQTWDAVRSLDYLAAHPLADPARLASTGNSGGGTLTMLLAAVDSRLACAAPVCPNTENLACENYNPPGSTDDAEQDFLASGPLGFDRWDTLYPLAPKPLLILVSGKDSFGTYSPRYLESGREEFSRLARVYEILGRRDHLAWGESPLPHGLSYDMRMAVYQWFRRHLQSIEEPLAAEPPVKAEPDDVLYASPTGNVVRDFGGLTPRAIAQRNAAAIATPPAPETAALTAALGIDAPARPGHQNIIGETVSRGVRIRALDIPSARGVSVPAWEFLPGEGEARGTMLLVEPGGRNASWNEDGLCQELARQGSRVIATDVRGVGDLRPEFPRQSPGHAAFHQREEAFAWASLMLGKPLLGQRVSDLLAVRRAAAPDGAILAARGTMTVPALFAALLDPSISALALSAGIDSYRELLASDEFPAPLANVLFGVLRVADLPQLRSAIQARGVSVRELARWDAESLLRV